MYGWLWRHLPGAFPVRALLALVLVAGAVVVLLFVVFPVIDPHLPWNNVNVSPSGGSVSNG